MESKQVNSQQIKVNHERAARLKTRAQVKKQAQQQLNIDQQKDGLDFSTYWEQRVKCKDDVIKCYELYFPDYPKELVTAIAIRLETLREKVQNKEVLTDNDWKYIRCQPSSGDSSITITSEQLYWDPIKEMEEQKLLGHLKLTEQRLLDLSMG